MRGRAQHVYMQRTTSLILDSIRSIHYSNDENQFMCRIVNTETRFDICSTMLSWLQSALKGIRDVLRIMENDIEDMHVSTNRYLVESISRLSMLRISDINSVPLEPVVRLYVASRLSTAIESYIHILRRGAMVVKMVPITAMYPNTVNTIMSRMRSDEIRITDLVIGNLYLSPDEYGFGIRIDHETLHTLLNALINDAVVIRERITMYIARKIRETVENRMRSDTIKLYLLGKTYHSFVDMITDRDVVTVLGDVLIVKELTNINRLLEEENDSNNGNDTQEWSSYSMTVSISTWSTATCWSADATNYNGWYT